MRIYTLLVLASVFSYSFLSTRNDSCCNYQSGIDSVTIQPAIHVLVALCDNTYQGIVKVPEKIGNGQNPDANLYWGCGYGFRTFFNKSPNWTLIKKTKNRNEIGDSCILERLVYQHQLTKRYLVADAYNGKYIEKCTRDLIGACQGKISDTLQIKGQTLGILAYSDLIVYNGHDGLMDFEFTDQINSDSKQRECIILACYSKSYFENILNKTACYPLVWTSGLMCPEAYTSHDAIEAWLQGKSRSDIRNAAASAYSRYQKCSPSAASRLLVQGF